MYLGTVLKEFTGNSWFEASWVFVDVLSLYFFVPYISRALYEKQFKVLPSIFYVNNTWWQCLFLKICASNTCAKGIFLSPRWLTKMCSFRCESGFKIILPEKHVNSLFYLTGSQAEEIVSSFNSSANDINKIDIVKNK